MADEVAPLLSLLERAAPAHFIVIVDPPSGLRAFLVLDNFARGPAAGGVRTWRYPRALDGLADALRLARAMTLKCALAGIDAGGGKCVVLDHDDLDRRRAFEELGRRIEDLRGAFITAGDLGTRAADLEAMASRSRYVHTDDRGLAAAVARGLVRCIEACAAARGAPGVAGLRVAVQGAGAVGSAVVMELARAGASVVCADLDTARAEEVIKGVAGARVVSPDDVLFADVDIVAPCAAGGVLTVEAATRLRAWAVCGAANNILATPEAGFALAERGILHVPDTIASAGAVIEGIGQRVMGLADRMPLIDKLGETAAWVLREAKRSGRLPSEVAEALAVTRIQAA